MNLQLTTILNVAAAEMRTSRRLVRFWTVVAVLSVISLAGYGLSCLILSFTAPYSPSMGAATPLYLLGGIDPTFFLAFQMAALLLLFDSANQHTRNRIDEVLDSKPVSNLEYLTGRVLGTAFLLWLVATVNVLAMQCFGVVANAFNFNYVEPIQMHSIINLLLIDAPATLLVWSSAIVFLSVVLRVRILTIVVGLAGMFAWFFLVLDVPYSLLSIVSASSNDSLFVSDLVPDFPSWQTLAVRLATLLGAIALIVAAAIAMQRRDGSSPVVRFSTVLIAIGLCGGAYALSTTDVVSNFAKTAKWHQAHSSYVWNDSIEVVEISGTVQINPGKRLDIDLSLTLNVDDHPLDLLAFTFNPDMAIDKLELDGQTMNYSFRDGLIEIAVQNTQDLGSQHVLRVVAHGIPDPRFAYFDSAVDYMTDSSVPIRSVRILGRDGSVFRSNFVVLMPDVYWYPVPGPVRGDFVSTQRGRDFFNVDLSVRLSNESLRLIGTGITNQIDDNASVYRMNSEVPVPEIGLFAADYKSASVDIDGVTFSMHLHRRHAKNLNLVKGIEETFITEAKEWLQPYSDHNLTIPHKRIAFVEVPNRLRTVGGGWRMDNMSSLPGIALMKEQAFPRTNFNLAIRFAKREAEPDDFPETQVNLLSRFFEMGVGVDNLWTTVPEHLWSHVTSASGRHAEVLDQIVCALISTRAKTPQQFFSIYSTLHVANTTAVSPYTLTYGADPDGWAPWNFEVRESEVKYGQRQSIWSGIEQIGFSQLPSQADNQEDLELVLTKTNAIATAMHYANTTEKILGWLADVRLRFAGQSYTYDDLIQVADEHEVVVDPFLTDWLDESQLPAYSAKLIDIKRIADDEQGNPRYQTSIVVRNMEPVAGFITLHYYDQSSPRPMAGFSRIAGNSAKQFNLVESHSLNRVRIEPHLSLNRQPMLLWSQFESVPEYLSDAPAPTVEDSEWAPVEIGIVVDDLDPGFTVLQEVPRVKQTANLGPFDWFNEHKLEIELEDGLLSWDRDDSWQLTHQGRGMWNRVAIDGAYGKYRRTSTSLWNDGLQKFPRVTFESATQDSSLWTLDYHIPPGIFQRRLGHEMVYKLVITNGSSSYDVELVAKSQDLGWQKVDQFPLTEGRVRVELVEASGFGFVHADAIRWSKADDS